MEIDIDDINNYEYKDRHSNNARTKKRLQEIKDLGLTEVGIAHYGIKGVMSGLYVERVWSYNDDDWKSYIDWIKEIKETKKE